MRLDRRTFLTAAAAAPLIYGLHDVLGHPGDAEWFHAALRRMKETRRCGIVLVVPSDPRQRQAMGTQLRALLDAPYPDAHALFAEAVFICLTPELARGRVRSFFEKDNRILLDPDGRRLEADRVDLSVFQPKSFAVSFTALLHGHDAARLEGHARAIEKTLPAEIMHPLTQLDDASIDVRSEASAAVFAHADRMIPYLIHQGRNGTTEEARARCRALVEEFFRASAAERFGPRLPFGTSRAAVSADPCPACGLAVAPVRSRKLLRFLTR